MGLRKRVLLPLALLGVFALTATACGSDDDNGADGGTEAQAPDAEPADGDSEAQAPDPEPADDGLRVALVLPGSVNDKGFNQLAFEALPILEARFGAETAFSEMTPVNEFEQAFEDFASDGYNVVIGSGFEFGEVAEEVAPEFPDVIFLVTNHPSLSGPNMQGLQPASQDAAYLAGVVAGMSTDTKKIGGIAGFEFPIIVAQMEAFAAGARSIDPEIEVTLTYIGTFDDVEAGKETARAMISSDIDILYHIADAAGLGVIQAAREEGVLVVGWGGDQTEVAPDTLLTSQIVDQTLLVVEAVRAVHDGEFVGEPRFFALDSPVLGLAPVRVVDNVDEIDAKVAEVEASILDGSFDVPFITEPSN